jgi:hypothetical protein
VSRVARNNSAYNAPLRNYFFKFGIQNIRSYYVKKIAMVVTPVYYFVFPMNFKRHQDQILVSKDLIINQEKPHRIKD